MYESDFYRHNVQRLLVVAYLLVFLIFTLLGILYYQYIHAPNAQYFASTLDGRLVEIYPAH
jgi:hypothetical protein